MHRHFHLSMKPVRRSKGESSVGIATYQSAIAIRDERTGILYDFRSKRGVAHAEIILPAGAPQRLLDPAVLWNEVESIQRKNGQPARRMELSLPWCMSDAARIEYCQEYARSIADRFGVAVHFAIHAPDQFGRDDPSVPIFVKGSKLAFHAHFLLTTNTIDSNGWGDKHGTRELDGICARKRKEGASGLKWLRRTAAELQNEALRKSRLSYRVSHLSLVEQRAHLLDSLGLPKDISRRALEQLRWDALKRGSSNRFAQIEEAIELDREPIGKVGKCAMALERKGIKTRVAEEKLHGPRRRNAERAAESERLRALLASRDALLQHSIPSVAAEDIASPLLLETEENGDGSATLTVPAFVSDRVGWNHETYPQGTFALKSGSGGVGDSARPLKTLTLRIVRPRRVTSRANLSGAQLTSTNSPRSDDRPSEPSLAESASSEAALNDELKSALDIEGEKAKADSESQSLVWSWPPEGFGL